MGIRNLRTLVRSTIDIGREEDLSLLAASVAFFAFLSLIPLVILVLVVGSVVGGEQFATQIVSLFENYLSEEGSQVLSEALADPPGRVGASAVSILALLWSALKVFRAIDISFDRIYRIDESTSLPWQLLHGIIVLVTITFGFGVLLTFQMVLVQLGIERISPFGIVQLFVVLAGLVIVLVPLYYVMPPISVSAREILPGIVAAAIGLLLLQQLFGVYTAHADQFQAYGLIGVVLLFLLWLYFSALVLLIGAAVNAAVRSQRRKTRDELDESSEREELISEVPENEDESSP